MIHPQSPETSRMRRSDFGEGSGAAPVRLHLTPADWRHVLSDPDFLKDGDNSWSPRRLMGLSVEIVPDHRLY